MDGVEGELEAVGNAELIEDVVEVVLHRLFADEELFADFAIAEALGDELDNLLLAVAEKRLFAALTGFGGFLEGVYYLGRHPIIQPDFAVGNLADAFEKEVAGGLLEDDAAGAETHGANDVAIVFGGGEDDDAGGKRIEIDLFEDAEAVFFGHAKIEQKDIGLELGEHFDALGAVGGFADDGNVVGAFEKLAKAVTKDGMVVRHQDASRLFRLGHFTLAVN